jgi:hydrogenase expression/formation protein HypE
MKEPPMDDGKVLLSHGSGGRRTRDLIEKLIVKIFDNPVLRKLEDSADLSGLGGAGDGRLVMTTDSYVVRPLFFPGGDIGRLSICGTVNDLATAGARPLALSAGLIIEEGFLLRELEQVLVSMRNTADRVPVPLVTGDTKVVERGRGDGIYICTTGVGLVPRGVNLSPERIEPGDVIIINGPVGNHEASILCARGDFSFDVEVQSDCAPLSSLMQTVVGAVPELKCARDPTRGGVASVLTEMVECSGCGMTIEEQRMPIDEAVQAICDILGMDPLMMANEGKMIVIAPEHRADDCLEAMRTLPEGAGASIIGQVHAGTARLTMKTPFGTTRVITMPMGYQFPRIC